MYPDTEAEQTRVGVAGERTPARDLAGEAVVLDPFDDTWAVLIPDQRTVEALKSMLPRVTNGPLRAGIWNNLRSGFQIVGFEVDARAIPVVILRRALEPPT